MPNTTHSFQFDTAKFKMEKEFRNCRSSDNSSNLPRRAQWLLTVVRSELLSLLNSIQLTKKELLTKTNMS